MKTILLIEDDAILRENTTELLELAQYNVINASNGVLGLAMAKKHHPDIVVCDIMMPELDGYGVLKALSTEETTKYIPFIFLSAKTERSDVRKGMNLGADDYITKPFTEEELVNAIESRMAKMEILKDIQSQNKTEPIQDETEHIRTLNDLKNFLDDNGETFTFKEGDFIYKEGEHSNMVYLIQKGVIKCHKLDEQGKELTTTLHNEDELFGYTSFTQNVPYQETATAMKDTQLIGVSKMELKAVLHKNQSLTLELIQLLNDDLTMIKEQLVQMAYSSVSKKTAATILKFAEKMNRKPDETIKISRYDLASVAGIATETLIRTLSSFKKQGLIEIDGRTIKILNLNQLREMT